MNQARRVVLRTARQERYLLAAGVLKDAGVPFFAQGRSVGGLRIGAGTPLEAQLARWELEVPVLVEAQARAILADHAIPAEDAPGDEPAPRPVSRILTIVGAGAALAAIAAYLLLYSPGR